MNINKLIEDQSMKSHLEWLQKAETAKIKGEEMTVISYGFLSQAVEKSIKELLLKFIEVEIGEIKKYEVYDDEPDNCRRIISAYNYYLTSLKEEIKSDT